MRVALHCDEWKSILSAPYYLFFLRFLRHSRLIPRCYITRHYAKPAGNPVLIIPVIPARLTIKAFTVPTGDIRSADLVVCGDCFF